MLLSPNSIAWPVILYGCIAAGIKCSPANPAYTAYELLYQYENSGSKTIIVHPQSISVVLKIFELQKLSDVDARRRMIVADLWTQIDVPNGFVKLSELMDKGIMEREEPFYGQLANETALMCYSSGTTGRPKGVEVAILAFRKLSLCC
jgi:acyl-CoA synthetase (AMP-forming)/AMP-acid ligase II